MPSAYTSVAGVSWCPSACSGAMYAGVPSTSPVRVAIDSAPPMTFAMPKSETFSVPVPVNRRFSGLMSRWRIPFPCACCSALAAAITMLHAASADTPSDVNRLQTVPPESSSITSRQRPSLST